MIDLTLKSDEGNCQCLMHLNTGFAFLRNVCFPNQLYIVSICKHGGMKLCLGFHLG
jgi:hypothetical protein